jgi:hypothetical protein
MSEEINQYLWDGTGDPDAVVTQLENSLRVFRFAATPLQAETSCAITSPTARRKYLRWLVPIGATIAACALLIFSLSVWRLRWSANSPWSIATVQGTPKINGTAIGSRGQLAVGEVLETDANSSADVRVARIGVMRVEPGSRVELISTRSGKHRIALRRGTISAQLWAPPWSLEMVTPSAMAFDLGCKFTLEVSADGSGVMRVSSGWVELESNDLQTLVPAGAVANMREGYAPGSPYFEDATEEFKAAVQDLNFGAVDSAHRERALKVVVNEARAKDVVTLFNLFARAGVYEREMLYARAAALDPPPPGTTREGILEGDEVMMNRWWQTLGLGDAKKWWIHWEDAF